MNIDTVIVIPARGGSKGIPRKNLKLINGKPLISFAINIAKNVKSAQKIIVSTDDNEIYEVSKKYDIDVIERPSQLANDNINLLPVNQHALKVLSNQDIYPNWIVSLQPTSPLILSSSIDEAINLIYQTNCDSVSSMSRVIHNHPYWTKKIDQKTKRINDFIKENGDEYLQKQDLPTCYSYTGGFYIRNRNILQNGTGKGLGSDARGYVVSQKESLDIDYEQDLQYFRYLINN